ncbi:unnamed protein product, partial [Staurois parvus]
AQVGALLGTGGCTAGHRWAELVGALLGTGGRNLWVALLGTDHQGTDHQCPDREESAAENRHLHFPVISVSLDTADHVVKGRYDWPFTTSRDQL